MSTSLKSIVNYFVGTSSVAHITEEDAYDKDVFDEHLRALASFGVPVWEETPEAEREAIAAAEDAAVAAAAAAEAASHIEEPPSPLSPASPLSPTSPTTTAPVLIEDVSVYSLSSGSTAESEAAIIRALAEVEEKHMRELDGLRADFDRRLQLSEEMVSILRSDNQLEVVGLKKERDATVQSLQAKLAMALQDADKELHTHEDQLNHRIQRMKIAYAHTIEQMKRDHAIGMAKRERRWDQVFTQVRNDQLKRDETQKKELKKRQNKIDQLEHLVEGLTAELHKSLKDLIDARRKHQKATESVVKQMEEHALALQAIEASHAAALEAKIAELKKRDDRHAHHVTRMQITHAYAIQRLELAHASQLSKLQKDHASQVELLKGQLTDAEEGRVDALLKDADAMEELNASHAQELQSTRISLTNSHKEELDSLRSAMSTVERIHREAIDQQKEAFSALSLEHAAELTQMERDNSEQVRSLLDRLEELRADHRACEPRRLELEITISALKERSIAMASELEASHREELQVLKDENQRLQVQLDVSRHALDTIQEEANDEVAQLADADERHRAELAQYRNELEAANKRINETEAELQRAVEDNSRMMASLEQAQAEMRELRELRAQQVVRPVTPSNKSTEPFPSHPTPPMTPRSAKRSFGDEHLPSPGASPAASPAHSRQASTSITSSPVQAQEHPCRMDSFSQKYHIPAFMHLPHSMHRCQKDSRPSSPPPEVRQRRPTLLIKRSRRSMRNSSESGASQVGATLGGH